MGVTLIHGDQLRADRPDLLAVTPECPRLRATWRDWLADGTPEPHIDTLLTRDQVLARLARGRVKITTSDLRYWEQLGVLPRPVRRWHNGSVRALYPRVYLDWVRQLRRLQREGHILAAIGPLLRAQARGGAVTLRREVIE